LDSVGDQPFPRPSTAWWVEHPEQYLVVTDFFSAGVVRPDTVIDKFAESFGLSIEGETLEPTKAAGYGWWWTTWSRVCTPSSSARNKRGLLDRDHHPRQRR
jgi:hypothetical protein